MNTLKSKRTKLKAKRAFVKKGTCSHALFYILNREWGHPIPEEERAIDTLAGGIMQQGYQCGMLWGAAMAIGAESGRRNEDDNIASGMAMKATQHVMKSFVERTKSTECIDISKCDFTNKWDLAKMFFSGRFISCFQLAGKWAPEAVEAANEGLDLSQEDLPPACFSCASEVIKKMGGSRDEMLMVAGFAGGLGFSGSGCGALAAVIWKKSLDMYRETQHKPSYTDPELTKIINAFYEATDYEMQCKDITKRDFKSIKEHSEFIRDGGCKELIEVLSG